MKKITCIIYSILFFASCKKSKHDTPYPYPVYQPLNAVLYSQPLDTVERYVQGPWRLIRATGGIAGDTVYYSGNSYLFFNIDSMRRQTDSVETDYYISHNRAVNIFGDTTHLMFRTTGNDTTGGIILQKIVNDTLYMIDNYADGYIHIALRVAPVY